MNWMDSAVICGRLMPRIMPAIGHCFPPRPKGALGPGSVWEPVQNSGKVAEAGERRGKKKAEQKCWLILELIKGETGDMSECNFLHGSEKHSLVQLGSIGWLVWRLHFQASPVWTFRQLPNHIFLAVSALKHSVRRSLFPFTNFQVSFCLMQIERRRENKLGSKFTCPLDVSLGNRPCKREKRAQISFMSQKI